MGAPISLLGQARAFARDYARDQMPRGYLWDLVDYVPLLDANLTGRGGWLWGSAVMPGDPTNGILATYSSGERLLIIDSTGALIEVNQTSPYPITNWATGVPIGAQN